MKVKISWQGDSPLLTPQGRIDFKDGVSLQDVPETVIKRLKAIYGDKIEVIDEVNDKHKEDTKKPDSDRPKETKQGSKGRRAKVS